MNKTFKELNLKIKYDSDQDNLKENFEPTPSIGACMFCSYQSICDAKIIDE